MFFFLLLSLDCLCEDVADGTRFPTAKRETQPAGSDIPGLLVDLRLCSRTSTCRVVRGQDGHRDHEKDSRDVYHDLRVNDMDDGFMP